MPEVVRDAPLGEGDMSVHAAPAIETIDQEGWAGEEPSPDVAVPAARSLGQWLFFLFDGHYDPAQVQALVFH